MVYRHGRPPHDEHLRHGAVWIQHRVRDNGAGIDTAVLNGPGRPGHFGLLGMPERAAKLRAQLDLWSRVGAGTKVDLEVPARVAYRPKLRRPRFTCGHDKELTQ